MLLLDDIKAESECQGYKATHFSVINCNMNIMLDFALNLCYYEK